MGKDTKAIFEFSGVDMKAYVKKIEAQCKRESEIKRQQEEKRRKNPFKLHTQPNQKRNRSSDHETSLSPTHTQPLETVTFTYVNQTEANVVEEYKMDPHEYRETKENQDICKLIKQFFEVEYKYYHNCNKRRYHKPPLQITCFGQFSEDRSQIDFLEADYSNSYSQPLLTIKNLGRYDCWEDLPWQEWLEKCKNNKEDYDGTSPMYDHANDKFMWNPVKVNGYDEAKLRYNVVFVKTTKEVSRLSLLFRWEQKSAFEYRKYLCEKRRNIVDQLLLFTRYIDNVPIEIVSSLNATWQKTIEAKVRFTTRRLSEMYNYIFDENRPSYQRELIIVNQDFIRQMKKCRILLEMQEPGNVARFKERSLDIKPFYQQIPIKKCAIVNHCPDFQKNLRNVNTKSFFEDRGFIEKVVVEFLRGCQQLKKINIILSSIDTSLLPLELDDYKKINSDFLTKSIYNLKNQCSNKFTALIRSYGHENKFNFLVSTKEDYEKSLAKRVVIYFNLILKNKAKELVDNSIYSFMSFFKAFGKCQYNGEHLKLLKKEIKSHYLESKIPLFMSKIILKRSEIKDKKKAAQQGVKVKIIFKPSLNECKTLLVESYTEIKSIIGSEIKNLATLCFKLVDIEDSKIYTLENDYPLYAEGLQQLNEIIDECKEEAEERRKEFEVFLEILNDSAELYVKNNLGDKKETNKNLDVNKCQEILEHLNKLFAQLNTMESQIDLRLFRIITDDIKRDINEKISDIMKLMIERMKDYCISRTEELEKESKEKIDLIKENPQDIDQYKAIFDILETIQNFVKRKKEELTNVAEILRIIENQKFNSYEEAIQLFKKLLKSWGIPNEITDSAKRSSDNMEMRKVEFTEELKKDQADFKTKILDLDKEFNIINKVDSFTEEYNGQKFFSFIEEFKDQLIEWKANKEKIRKEMVILTPEKKKEIEDGSEDLPEFEKLESIIADFQPYKILWEEDGNVMSEYENKVNTKTLLELKELLPNNDRNSTKEVFIYIKDLEESRLKVEEVQKKNQYDSTLIKLVEQLRAKLDYYESFNWIIQCLNSACIKEDDWKEIRNLMNDQSIDLKIKLIDLHGKGIENYRDQIERIKNLASKRAGFVQKYKDLNAKYNEIKLEEKDERKSGLKKIDEVLILLDELSNQLVNIIGNPVTQSDPRLKNDSKALNEKIKNAQIILEEVIKFQSNYLYLEPIFNATEINKALANEKTEFMKVHTFWRNFMDNVEAIAWYLASYMDKENFNNLNKNFNDNNTLLQKIIRKLNEYLNIKRQEFPRFYFVSDEDLLRILAQSKNPLLVQAHLSKCFEGIHHVNFNESITIIQSMVSTKDECVPLIKEINVVDDLCRGNVEVWLGLLEESMRNTMKNIAKNCLEDYHKKERIDWIKDMEWPGQLVQIIDQIVWTTGVEEGITNTKLPDFLKQLDHELSQVVDLVRSTVPTLLSITLSGLIVISVHNRDIVERLIKEDIKKITDFEWKAQMRYYYHQEDENKDKKKKNEQICPITVSMITTNLNYGFEYLGNITRLVITPLTDRCFRTLFGAYNVKYGGAPEGPAGTGKTESVKDLSKCVGVMCNVFNCTEGIKIQGMSKFFKGLASSGCWCCFDEFNRIDTEVLSVIAQQILTIQNALKAKLNYFYFEENEKIVIKDTCAINITMNPSYSGRNELPDNLKALFRPCAMMVADYNLIAQIKLYSFGFQTAKPLSFKIVSSLKLSSEQLSTQSHYDFGMRSLNAILVAAGKEKKRNPDLAEDRIALRALVDVNLPKFTSNDSPLFYQLVHDLFPTTEELESSLKILEDQIGQSCLETNLQPTNNFIKKCIQLFETMNVRHALMIVGKPGTGKTKVINTLKRSITMLKDKGPGFNKVDTITLNPKSLLQKNLYGWFDMTQEWKKGLLQVKMTELVEKEKEILKWLIFDGPVDTLWIENMNSLLDDNKKLCLEDSSSIFLADNMNIVFEVDDLKEASPATVSRNGMVLCETDTIAINDMIESYAMTLPDNYFNEKLLLQFRENAKWLAETVIHFLFKQEIEFGLPCSKFHLVDSFLKIFDCYMRDYKNKDEILPKGREITPKKLDNLLISSVLIGICGPMKNVPKFQHFLYELCAGKDVNNTFNLHINLEHGKDDPDWKERKLEVELEDFDNIFNMVYTIETAQWYKWTDIPNRTEFVLNEEQKFNELVIPTPETIKMDWLLSMVIPNKIHLLLTGNTGTGKTLTILNTLMSQYDTDFFTYIKMSMTAQTTAGFTQELIEKKLQKSYRKFSPLGGKKGVIFVDDLNMPQKEKYGAQPPIELLRQWMDYGGWYDLVSDGKDFINVIDISFLASMGSIASGRTVTSRYLRHFLIHYAENYSQETMNNIFSQVVQWFFIKTKQPTFSSKVIGFKDYLIKSTIAMYQEVSSTFKATPAKTHYQFNLRDVSRVFLGISRTNARTVKDEQDLTKLWIHECERVFKDRLVNEEDRGMYDQIIAKVMKTVMRRDAQTLSESNLWGNYVPMIFIDGDPKKGVIERQYCELNEPKLLKDTLENKLNDYNRDIGNRSESGGPLHLVLFQYAINHLNRILRIISTYNGNAVLVGVGGSGRKSLTMLSSFIYNFVMIQYESDWTETLKAMMRELGNKEVVFLVSDSQIDDKQIEDLNNMLNNGEIPNLIDAQDLQVIRDNIPAEYTQGKKLQSDQETMTAFIENCKAKIHIALCLSPIGDGFRKRILMFPSLVSCTTIDWFLSWPEDALSSVAEFYLSDVKEIDQSFFKNIINICVDMQSRVIGYSQRYYQELRRYNYVTPMSFIELLNLFKTLLKKRTVEINDEIQRYKNGLIVIAESEELSAKMEKDIKKLEPELTEQKEVTKRQVDSLKDLKIELEKAEADGKIAEEEAKEIAENASEQNAIANETLMLMEEKKSSAEEKLNSIDPNSVAEFKKYKFDEPVNRFCEFLCMLMLNNPHPKPKAADNPKKPATLNYFEHACKNILNISPSDFLKKLKNFDSSKMSHEQMVSLRTKINENKDYSYFDPSKKSLAVNNLYQVIVDHNNIFFINVEYMPIKTKAEECAEKLRQAQEKLKDIQEKLDNTKKTKAAKEEELRKANEMIANLEAKLHKCHVRLDNANILGNSLGSEKEQWKRSQESLETYAKNIIGDILVSCGIISYLGAFTKAYRELILQDWAKKVVEAKIPLSVGDNKSPNDIMRGILGDDMEIETWKSQKLPNDNFSTDNAIIMNKSRRFCLLIDPQNQALIWLKEKIKQESEAARGGSDRKRKPEGRNERRRKDGGTGDHYTIKPTMDNKTLLEVTIDCIQEGHPLIYENVGEVLSPLIAPIYKKEFYKSGGATYVNLNKQPYDVHDHFRFFIITQLPKPHYLPEVCVALTLVNFTVTEEGLEDQMLNFLVEKEDPALSQLRKECIDIKNVNERKKKEIEKDILIQLDQSKKNATEDCTILDNEKLIEKLKQSNQTRIQTLSTLKKQAETEGKITIKRSFLRPVATHVSQLFFTVCDLSSIEPVYQYSLKFYQDIFGFAIDMTPKEKVDPKMSQDKEKNEALRLEKLMKNFDEMLYNKICMSLFEKDKLVFSFLLQIKLKMIPMTSEERAMFNKEVRFLVTGGSGKEYSTPNPAMNDPQEWITQVTWNSLCELSESLEKFKGLDKSFIDNISQWKEVMLSVNPFEQQYPAPFDALTDFYKMIILRILRQDKTIPALKKYITENMEEKYVISPSFDIGKAYDESRNKTPILFIISPGADPLILIDKLCKREGKSLEEDVKTLSLGQGQEKTAIEAIDKAQERDQEKWILLQNCHLAKSFMNMLEKKIEEIQDTGSSFRLFLTALPSKVIPISVIQDSIKIVNEPPRGLKQSIQRTFGTIDEYIYEKCSKSIIFKRFVFGFCFFHAMILERRKYGPLGWNIPYEFSNSDLSISVAQLNNFLDDYDDIQYDALQYMIAEANYGGRVTDPSDRRLIAILFSDICTEDILDDRYCFSNMKEYPVPLDGTYQDHEEFINKTIPLNSLPGVFGLHDNADIACAMAETNSLFDTALLTLPRTVSAKAGASTEDQVKERAEEILKKLPNVFDVEAVRQKYTDTHYESLNSVLQQELMRYNNLLTIVRNSLKNMKDAIEGNAVMTIEIEAMVRSVYDNKTPEKIAKVSYPSMMSFSSWVNDFIKKIEFLNKWIKEGIPSTFWISAFYFTHSFLTGILQNYARKYKIAIDELGFEYTVMSDIKEYDLTQKPEDGCYIYGLYIEGARWNSEIRLLDDSLPKVLLPAMPHVWFRPAKKDENKKVVDYECPVYRTTKRSGELLTTGQSTNFLIHMFLPFDQEKYTSEHWVKRGTAVICSLNE